MVCEKCKTTVTGEKCECGSENLVYDGLKIHDFRRSAARELRRLGVAQSTIMDIGGWKTASMFKRYAITDPKDIALAVHKREEARAEFGHSFGHSQAPGDGVEADSDKAVIN